MTARQISQLTLGNSRSTTTFSKQPRSRQDQIITLKREFSQMAQAISNPVHRSLCEMAVSRALQQIDDEFGVEPFTEANDSTDTNPEDANPEEGSPKGANPKDMNPKGANPQDTSPKNINPKDTNPKDTNPKDTSPKDTNPKDTNPKDIHPKDTNPKDTKSQNTNPQCSDFISKESYSRKPDWKIHTVMEKSMKLKNMLGTIHVTSKTFLLKSRYNEHRDQYEHEMLITMCPAPWLVKLGISFAPKGSLFHSSVSGWKYKLNPFRLVPSDALIFEFCQNNNLAGVQSLLSRGEASVKDMNFEGRTPLHVGNSLNLTFEIPVSMAVGSMFLKLKFHFSLQQDHLMSRFANF